MPLNKKGFQTRALTAIVFAVVMLAGLLWNQWSFLVLFSIIHFGCWWEFFNLVEKIFSTRFHAYIKLGMMVMGYGLMLWFCSDIFQIKGYGIKENISLPVSGAGFAVLLVGIFQRNPVHPKAFAVILSGLVYISLAWGFMLDLYSINKFGIYDSFYIIHNYFIPVLVIASIWINDTMAYIVGSLIGKTPLTKISPKKTWEGTIGGMILSVVVMALVFPLVFNVKGFNIKIFIAIIAAIASVMGTLGDILESKMKRLAGVKDSGSFMPGHGGFLDRFDSLLLATPFVWIFVFFCLK